MTEKILDNLHYPKPNTEDLNKIYSFEIDLMEAVLNSEIKQAVKLYEDFFSKKYIYNIIGRDHMRCLKNYMISLCLLISHSVIKKSVSPYSAKSKYNAFSKLIENCESKDELLNLGKTMITGYATLVSRTLNQTKSVSIRKAIDYIHNNLGNDLTLDQVAAHANLSKCYFCTQFKKETKMSFTDYLSYARIEKSKYLLCNSDKSILDIAILVGFNSQSYFTTQFKKYTGISPKDFRQKKDRNYIF